VVAIDAAEETMHSANLSLPPPAPSVETTSDIDTVEEAQVVAEYYYDGETQPFFISPAQILTMTDISASPTPSIEEAQATGCYYDEETQPSYTSPEQILASEAVR